MDNYVLVERLGQGSFAVVWKARRKADNRLVAVKQLRQAPATWDDCKRLPEIKAAAAVRAPYVIALLEAVRHGGELFLVFEHADSDLCRCLQRGNRFTEPQVRWAMRQLLAGLSSVHAAGLVHCDVKPENLLLFNRAGTDNAPALKLCDLGQATAAGEVQSYIGTRWYRAPELLLGEGKAGIAIDLWAAGCAMAELFLLRPPFPGTDTRDMLFRICSALGAPEEHWHLGERLVHASGLRFAPSAAEGPIWFELLAAEASHAAVELMKGLLRYEGTQRVSAARALQSAFFAPSALEHPILPPEADRGRALSGERLQRSRDEAKAVERRLHAASNSVSQPSGNGSSSSAPTSASGYQSASKSAVKSRSPACVVQRGETIPALGRNATREDDDDDDDDLDNADLRSLRANSASGPPQNRESRTAAATGLVVRKAVPDADNAELDQTMRRTTMNSWQSCSGARLRAAELQQGLPTAPAQGDNARSDRI